MLHQPSSTFKPASPAGSFDPKAFITRARQLGLIIFPTIYNDGGRAYGLTTPGQRGFSARNLSLSDEFADIVEATPNATARVFDALCDDLGVDPADPDFNKQVNAICRREDQVRQGDRKLLALCRRAEKIVAEDGRLEDCLSKLDDSFMLSGDGPKRPEAEGVCRLFYGSATEMRAELRRVGAEYTKQNRDLIRIHINRIAAWEVELRAAQVRHGLTAAKAASRAAGAKTRRILDELVPCEATTAAGVAAKSRVMIACLDIGYGYDGQFEALARSIFEDARQVDDQNVGEQMRRRHRGDRAEPCAQPTAH